MQCQTFWKVWAAARILPVNWTHQTGAHLGSLWSGNRTVDSECLGHEGRPIRPSSCSTMLCPASKVAFWPKLFTTHRFRGLIWHSVASQVAEQSTGTVVVWRTCKQSWHLKLSLFFFFILKEKLFSTNVSLSPHRPGQTKVHLSVQKCFATLSFTSAT